MSFAFDPELAALYGLDEAVMIQYLQGWIRHNRNKGSNLHEGKTWTYNSLARFAEMLPFWSFKQIRRILSSLRRQGVLTVGHFAKFWSDRTNWYAFVDEAKFLGAELAAAFQKPSTDGFVEKVAEAYNELLESRKLTVDPNSRRFRAKVEALRETRSGLSVEQIREGLTSMIEDVGRDPSKASFLHWKSLFHPNVIGRAIDKGNKGPPAGGPPPPPDQDTGDWGAKRFDVEATENFYQEAAGHYNRHIAGGSLEPVEPSDVVFRDLCRTLRNQKAGLYESLILAMIASALEEAGKGESQEDLAWQEVFLPDRMEDLIGKAADAACAPKERPVRQPQPEEPKRQATPEETEAAKERFQEMIGKLASGMDADKQLEDAKNGKVDNP